MSKDWACLKCGVRFDRLTVQRDHNDKPLMVHDACGTAFTPEFLEDHYGIPATSWSHDPALLAY